jgi:hypothetical protein
VARATPTTDTTFVTKTTIPWTTTPRHALRGHGGGRRHAAPHRCGARRHHHGR